MPDDLKYMAIAESALRPHAGSRKGAIGFWQFMKPTGTKYDLVINERIDERRNIFASTSAAIRYLKELYESLIMWNSLDPNRPIHPGDHLIVSPK